MVNQDHYLKLQSHKEDKVFIYFETLAKDYPILTSSLAPISSVTFLFDSGLIDYLLLGRICVWDSFLKQSKSFIFLIFWRKAWKGANIANLWQMIYQPSISI
ncbi:unnamed protein product [Prunus armeniaca]